MGEEEEMRRLLAEARELSFGGGAAVDRLDSPPTSLEFLRDYVAANKPCIVSVAATAHWPAISLWSDDAYLLRALKSQVVSVHLTPDGRADALAPSPSGDDGGGGLWFASPLSRRMGFPEALRLIAGTGEPSSPLVAYAQQQDNCFEEEYSALAADVDGHVPWASEALGCRPEATNMWIGNGRSETWFHKDHYENLYAVVSGEKHFILLPPTEAHRLYVRRYPTAHYAPSPGGGGCSAEELRLEMEDPGRQVPWCSVDPYPPTPEAMERQISSFPLYFQGPEPFQCTLRAGEMLYLPSMWFHHVRQTPDLSGRAIAINYWYDMKFDIKYAYFNFLQSVVVVDRTVDDQTIDDDGDGQLPEDDTAT